MDMKKKKALWITLSVIVGVFVLLPLIGVGVLKWAILPPERLTPLVVGKVNEFIEAHLDCERVELTYLDTYPYLGVRLTNGHLISRLAEEDSAAYDSTLLVPSDSLLMFKRAVAVFNPTEYFFNKTLIIPWIRLDSISFYGYVNEDGKANWEIYQSELDSIGEEMTDSSSDVKIDLRRVQITNGHFIYDDCQQDLYAEMDGFFLRLEGALTGRGNKLDIETGTSSINFESASYSLSNDLSLRFKGRFMLAEDLQQFGLRDAELMVNDLPFNADGFLALPKEDRPARVGMKFGLKVEDLNDLLSFIPDAYFKNRKQIQAKGSIFLEGDIRGEVGDSIVPTVNLCCKIEDGSYHVKGVEQGIDTLRLDVDLHLNGTCPDSSFVSLEELTVKGRNISLTMSGEVHDLRDNPAITANLDGQVDFTRLAEDFLNPDTLLVEGTLAANFSAAFTMDDLANSRFDKVQSSGDLSIDRFKAYSKPLGMNIYIQGANLSAGSTDKESRYLHTKGLLTADLSIDTLNVRYGEDVSMRIGGLRMEANTTPTMDTTAVIPLTASAELDHLWTKLPDSTLLVAQQAVFKGGIKASASDKRTPTAAGLISVDTLKYIVIPLRSGMVLDGSQFTLEALPFREALRQQWEMRAASGDTLRRQPRGRRARPDSTATSSENSTWKDWEARGSVKFHQLKGFSRLFPLPLSVEGTNVRFNTNRVTLTNALVRMGNSDFTLSGDIIGIRRAVLGGGSLKTDFELRSDLIDCNQLMRAIGQGMSFSEQLASNSSIGAFTEDSVAVLQQDTEQISLATDTAATDTTTQLFLVPKFLDMTLHTNAKHINFQDLQMTDVKGEVVVRDQSINLSELSMNSNIGSGDLTMVYTAKDEEGATMGFELSMDSILVDRLIGLFPAIDTLVPMLRSFEGVVDCQLTATCKTDSVMSILLPSLNVSCYLSGKNMVLLDGETFAEISKTLMFKNKKRNIIDSISVDFAIHDNQIEVFPFLVEMDRYKVAVGGTHNLDMTFDYHLSVLKSPVPFKLGIDIKGNLDDFKFKIVKCKYKDFLKPAKQAELDSTRRNVRENIREAIRAQIKEAAPELGNSLSHAEIRTPPPFPTEREIEEEEKREAAEATESTESTEPTGITESTAPVQETE